MAGQIRRAIDKIVNERSRGNQTIASTVRTKMILKGISVDKYNANSPDDPEIMKKLQTIAAEFGIKL